MNIDEETILLLTTAIGIAAAAYLILIFIKKFLYGRLNELVTYHPKYAIVLEILNNIKTFFIASTAIYFGSLVLPPENSQIFSKLFLIAMMLQIGILGSRLIAFFVANYNRANEEEIGFNKTAINLFEYAAKTAFWILITLFLLDNLKFDIATLIAGLGIGGIAIALAMQNILGDVLASVSIIADKPFIVGDLIQVDNFTGVVEHIGIKTTRMRSPSGEIIIFSNTDLLKSRMRNFKQMSERRAIFTLRFPYRTHLEKIHTVPSILKEIIGSTQNARFDRIELREFPTKTLDFEVVYYVKSSEYKKYMEVQNEINLKLLATYQKENVKVVVQKP